ncbi:MAG: 4-hydroxy-tetrahydrodipicolinate reductase [Ferruginibacter sp.]
MNIGLIGYGKMGKAIEAIALKKGHSIPLKIDLDNAHELTEDNLRKCDVVIEFTGPHSAVQNLKTCINAGIPVVCGSTGWLQHWDEIKNLCEAGNSTLLYASNFSIGVNIFFEINKKLAQLMSHHQEYDVSMEEIHHTQKKDAPSGTAITLAEQIMAAVKNKTHWTNETAIDKNQLSIISKRIDPAPGTHTVKYHSAVDDIEIIHTAHSREGFAAGAVMAAEFLQNKKGIFNMKDVLGI